MIFEVFLSQIIYACRVFVLYRSRQYYQSKVLHDTEVSLFLIAHGSLKNNHFDKNSYIMS